MMHVLLKDGMEIKEGDEFLEIFLNCGDYDTRWVSSVGFWGDRMKYNHVPIRRHLKTMDDVAAFIEECENNA